MANYLVEFIFNELTNKMKTSEGLALFASRRAKFEGWLKLELCDSLLKISKNVIPEKELIDVVFDDWAVELKTVNTSYRYESVMNKTRPITANVDSILADIRKLRDKNYLHKAVLFVVFPLETDKKEWAEHLGKVERELRELYLKPFRFKNGIGGVIYFGIVK